MVNFLSATFPVKRSEPLLSAYITVAVKYLICVLRVWCHELYNAQLRLSSHEIGDSSRHRLIRFNLVRFSLLMVCGKDFPIFKVSVFQTLLLICRFLHMWMLHQCGRLMAFNAAQLSCWVTLLINPVTHFPSCTHLSSSLWCECLFECVLNVLVIPCRNKSAL